MKKNKREHQPTPSHDHGPPVTRRDFLGRGLLAGSAAVVMPSLLTLAARRAFAAPAPCGLAPLNTSMVPVICIDLAGGAHIPGSNVMVGGERGQDDLLGDSAVNAYLGVSLKQGGTLQDVGDSTKDEFVAKGSNKTPLEVAQAGLINSVFGLKFHPDSGFLKGMLAETQAETRSMVDGMLLCTSSIDDTDSNPYNPAYWLAKSGLTGRLGAAVSNSAGRLAGNSTIPEGSFDARYRPITLTSAETLSSLRDPGSPMSRMLSKADDRNKIFAFMDRLSSAALSKFSSLELGDQVRTILSCGSGLTPSILALDQDSLTLGSDPIFKGAGGVFSSTDKLHPLVNEWTAVVCKALIEGYAGVGTITLGGYDYHSSNLTLGKSMDVQAGRVIGRILEVFRRKNKPVMIYVFTDGGVSNGNSEKLDPVWTSDDSEKSGAFILTFDPSLSPSLTRAQKPILREPFLDPKIYGRQIGHFQFVGGKLGVKRTSAVTASDIPSIARAVLANHMALHTDDLESIKRRLTEVTGIDNLTNAPGGVERYVAFRKIR